jgi:hypothetical protein
MSMQIRRALPLMIGSALIAAGLSASASEPGDRQERALLASVVVADWPSASALAARRLIAQYGVPDEVLSDRLAWIDNRPWKRTVVRRMAPADIESDDHAMILQTVEFPLTPKQITTLMAFDPRLSYDRKTLELGSRSEREETNFLRLNLANDIVNARMTPDQARGLFAQILRLEAAGKSASYLQVLFFPR